MFSPFLANTVLTYMKHFFTLVKMVQLSSLTDERMRKNEETCEGKIRPPDYISGPPDYISGRPLLLLGAALTPFRGGPNSILRRP